MIWPGFPGRVGTLWVSLLKLTSIPASHQPSESSMSFTLCVIRGTTVTLAVLAPDMKQKILACERFHWGLRCERVQVSESNVLVSHRLRVQKSSK